MADWTHAKGCAGNGSCIEVRLIADGMVAIRNSQNISRIAILISVSTDEWAAFVAGVKAGDFDHITEEATG
jgi:Domain of unknown function (DUF397)